MADDDIKIDGFANEGSPQGGGKSSKSTSDSGGSAGNAVNQGDSSKNPNRRRRKKKRTSYKGRGTGQGTGQTSQSGKGGTKGQGASKDQNAGGTNAATTNEDVFGLEQKPAKQKRRRRPRKSNKSGGAGVQAGGGFKSVAPVKSSKSQKKKKIITEEEVLPKDSIVEDDSWMDEGLDDASATQFGDDEFVEKQVDEGEEFSPAEALLSDDNFGSDEFMSDEFAGDNVESEEFTNEAIGDDDFKSDEFVDDKSLIEEDLEDEDMGGIIPLDDELIEEEETEFEVSPPGEQELPEKGAALEEDFSAVDDSTMMEGAAPIDEAALPVQPIQMSGDDVLASETQLLGSEEEISKESGELQAAFKDSAMEEGDELLNIPEPNVSPVQPSVPAQPNLPPEPVRPITPTPSINAAPPVQETPVVQPGPVIPAPAAPIPAPATPVPEPAPMPVPEPVPVQPEVPQTPVTPSGPTVVPVPVPLPVDSDTKDKPVGWNQLKDAIKKDHQETEQKIQKGGVNEVGEITEKPEIKEGAQDKVKEKEPKVEIIEEGEVKEAKKDDDLMKRLEEVPDDDSEQKEVFNIIRKYVFKGCALIVIIVLIFVFRLPWLAYDYIQGLFVDQPQSQEQVDTRTDLEGTSTTHIGGETIDPDLDEFEEGVQTALVTGDKIPRVKKISDSIKTVFVTGLPEVDTDSDDRIATYMILLQKLQNSFSTDVHDLIDNADDRLKALEVHIRELEEVLDDAIDAFAEINVNKDDIKIKFNEITTEKDKVEADFFVSLDQLKGNKSNSLLNLFIETSQEQIDAKAEYNALTRIAKMYDIAIRNMEARVKDIKLNKEALVKGVKVVNIAGSDLDLIIQESEMN